MKIMKLPLPLALVAARRRTAKLSRRSKYSRISKSWLMKVRLRNLNYMAASCCDDTHEICTFGLTDSSWDTEPCSNPHLNMWSGVQIVSEDQISPTLVRLTVQYGVKITSGTSTPGMISSWSGGVKKTVVYDVCVESLGHVAVCLHSGVESFTNASGSATINLSYVISGTQVTFTCDGSVDISGQSCSKSVSGTVVLKSINC